MDLFEQELTTIEGTIERVIYTSDDQSYTVALLRSGKSNITIVGNIFSLNVGESLSLTGKWTRHPKYGNRFQVESFRVLLPTDEKSIEIYLASGFIRGIGDKLAQRIVDKFGSQTLDIIDKTPERLHEVEGIGPKKIIQIIESWKEQQKGRDTIYFLTSQGISPNRAVKIYSCYGDNTVAVIKNNPYRLASDIDGIGFLTADSIAQKMGFLPDHPERIRAGLVFTLQEMTANNGHCYIPKAELLQEAGRILKVETEKVEEALLKETMEGRIVSVDDSGEPLYPYELKKAEETVINSIVSLLKTPIGYTMFDTDLAIDTIEKHSQIQLSQSQKRAITTVLSSKVVVITGGPGVGKTTLINGLVHLFSIRNISVSLAAPTGRAAKRLSEATGSPAMTIHRLLKYYPYERRFEYTSENPLPTDVVVIDESSMLDLSLASHTLSAIPAKATLILVGDSDQLPSVGPGNVLSDLIDSGVIPVVRLKEIFRQREGSSIIEVSHQINEGSIPAIDNSSGSDIFFIKEEDPVSASRKIVDLVSETIPKRYNFTNPLSDIQVLSPMYKGDVGAENLNRLLAEKLNPNGAPISRGRLRVGDKVMQIKNDYTKEVFNGDIGLILSENRVDQTIEIEFDGRKVCYDYKDMDQVVPAYTVSIHKSQGSEYPCVVIPVFTQHYIMLERNLLYTAITRGKKLVIIIGTWRALAIAVKNIRSNRRYTRLAGLLSKARPRLWD